jgi:hypothetical protein
MIDFYSHNGSSVSHGLASRYGGFPSGPYIGGGPTHSFGLSGVAGLVNPLHGARVTQRHSHVNNWPGIFRAERAARGRLIAPAAAAVTDDSTITLDDGVNVRVYEFDTDASGLVAGDVLVDLAGLVTPAEVAEALRAAISNDQAAANIDIAAFSPPDSAVITLLQVSSAFLPEVGTHAPFTNGAAGNNPIVASEPTEWLNIIGMAGGKDRAEGIAVVPGNKHQASRLIPLGNVFFGKVG